MSATATPAKLFEPIRVGNLELQHRVVLAPLTRYRADSHHVHNDLAVEYYRQRSSTPGTLLITEATFIAPEAGGYKNVPGLWNDDQVQAWRKVTDAVHANGSFIFAQLWALGRAAHADVLQQEPDGPFDVVSASDVELEGYAKPRPLSLGEIALYPKKYAIAAQNAITAGFDGVEIHNANGYLLDQFIQDVTNHRTDQYGGSVENRARLSLEVVDAVTSAIGADRTAIRISPWSRWQGMRMEDPVPTFSYLVEQLKAKHSNLAYIHVIEGSTDPYNKDTPRHVERSSSKFHSNDFVRNAWLPRPYITAGGYSEATGAAWAIEAAEQGALVAFGRSFIANPDLPLRIRKNLPLNAPDYPTIYSPESAAGYVDYPVAGEVEVKA